jgi:hypothetical protein
MGSRKYAIIAVSAALVGAVSFIGSAPATEPSDGHDPVVRASLFEALPSITAEASISDLFGKWASDNGYGLLLLHGDSTYEYAVNSGTLSTSEQGGYQVNGRRLTLAPNVRTAEMNGQEVQIRLDPLVMSIGTDSAGYLVLDLNGSTYHKSQ